MSSTTDTLLRIRDTSTDDEIQLRLTSVSKCLRTKKKVFVIVKSKSYRRMTYIVANPAYTFFALFVSPPTGIRKRASRSGGFSAFRSPRISSIHARVTDPGKVPDFSRSELKYKIVQR